jgi:hypothetical protein
MAVRHPFVGPELAKHQSARLSCHLADVHDTRVAAAEVGDAAAGDDVVLDSVARPDPLPFVAGWPKRAALHP